MPEPQQTSEATLTAKAIKVTKNTIKFEEVTPPGHPPVLGVVYIQKWWAGDAQQIEIRVKKTA